MRTIRRLAERIHANYAKHYSTLSELIRVIRMDLH